MYYTCIILMRNEIQIVLYTNVTGTNKITESCDSLFPELIKYIYKFWNKAINPVYSVKIFLRN